MKFAILFGVLIGAGSAGATEVRLRESASCAASVVRLADVAEIETEDQTLAAALGEIPLCPVPAAGGERTLTQNDVRQILALSGVEKGQVQVSGSQRVVLVGGTQPGAARPIRPATAGVRQAAFEAKTAVKPRATSDAAKPAPAAPRLVERGSNISVYARAAGVRIAASGKALAHGAAGETITVEMEGGKEKVQAKVIAPQAVEVLVAGSK